MTIPLEPPADIEAEQAILGAILQESPLFQRLTIPAECFHSIDHQRIVVAMRSAFESWGVVDVRTTASRLKDVDQLVNCGGVAYLSKLCDICNIEAARTPDTFDGWVAIVHDKWRQRQLIAAATKVAETAQKWPSKLPDLLAQAQREIESACAFTASEGPKQICDLVKQMMVSAQDAALLDTGITGTPSGFPLVDELTTGMQPGELWILAARPGVGKTSYALDVVRAAAERISDPRGIVLVFSLEMPSSQITTRMVSQASGVASSKIRTGRASGSEWDSVVAASEQVYSLPVFVDDTPAIGLNYLRTTIRNMQQKCERSGTKIGLVVIDYLQLMRGDIREKSRENEVAVICRGLKELAKSAVVPIMALAQLNRDVEKRPGGKPQLSDLRESGEIEQSADVVQFIWRPGGGDIAFISIAKQRNGPTNDGIRLRYQKESTHFTQHEDQSKEEEQQDEKPKRRAWEPK